MSELDDVRKFYAKYNPENKNGTQSIIDDIASCEVEKRAKELCEQYGLREDSPYLVKRKTFACIKMGQKTEGECQNKHCNKRSKDIYLPLYLCGHCWPMDHMLKAWREGE